MLLPRESISVNGAWNAVSMHNNYIEAGFLSGLGIYALQGHNQILQVIGLLREATAKNPSATADGRADTLTDLQPFVDHARLEELRGLPRKTFDLSRLIRLCEELNVAYRNACHHSVALLTRSILDHVPPIFDLRAFAEVASNYGSRSFKETMDHLQNSARKIADGHLHTPIRRTESLPNATQVNFARDLDVLLGEIARISRDATPDAT